MTRPIGEEVAILQQRVQDFDKTMAGVASDIKEIKNALVVQNDLRNEVINLKAEVDGLKKTAIELRESNGVWSWVRIIIAGACTSILTILIASYLDKLK